MKNYSDVLHVYFQIHVNPQNYLEIKRLGRADRGLSFSCASADNAGSVRKRVVSDKSDAFEVIPECKCGQHFEACPPAKDI